VRRPPSSPSFDESGHGATFFLGPSTHHPREGVWDQPQQVDQRQDAEDKESNGGFNGVEMASRIPGKSVVSGLKNSSKDINTGAKVSALVIAEHLLCQK